MLARTASQAADGVVRGRRHASTQRGSIGEEAVLTAA